MKGFVRLGAIVENLRGSLWLLPSLSVTASIAIGAWLSTVQLPESSPLNAIVFTGGPEGARGILQSVATSVITVTSLVFSLTVVTLQLASTQFSPRLLRTFLRLPANQLVLSAFLSTFVYSLVVLRSIHSEPAYVPQVAVTVGFLLVLVSVAALVYFINHITTEIRADTLMWRVEHDTLETISNIHPDPWEEDAPRVALPERPRHAVPLPSSRSGVVQAIAAESIRKVARERDATILLACHVGDRVVADGTLAWIWRADGTDAPEALRAAAKDVNEAVTIGHERTMQQDISYGIRQLVDMAAKALSPGVNDPTTAVDVVGHLAAILTVLARRRVEPLVLCDDTGTVRFALNRPTFAHYVDRSISQIRRYGGKEPDVLLALLDLCRELGEAAVTREQALAIREQLDLIVAAGRRTIEEPHDVEKVEQAAARVTPILEGARPPAIGALRGDA